MLCNSLNIQRRWEVYLRLNAYYSAVISAFWPSNGAGKFIFAIECSLHCRYLCVLTVKWRREVYLRLNAHYMAVIPALWPYAGAGKFSCNIYNLRILTPNNFLGAGNFFKILLSNRWITSTQSFDENSKNISKVFCHRNSSLVLIDYSIWFFLTTQN